MQICECFVCISLTTSSLYTQSTFSDFNEQLVYENIVLVCILSTLVFIITGGPFVTSAALHVVHAGHGHVMHVVHVVHVMHVVHVGHGDVVHVVYMMQVAWEYIAWRQHVIHAHCYLQLHRRKQMLPVLIYCIMSERCVYPLHVYHQAPFCHRTFSAEVQNA